MRRLLHLFEFTDLRGCPPVFRNLQTEWLRFMIEKFGPYDPTIPLLIDVLKKMKTNQVIDLCSGTSGAVLQKKIDEKLDVTVTLTDKYPHIDYFKKAKEKNPKLKCNNTSVDATKIKIRNGVKTIFSGFHHFRPRMARQILQETVDSKSALCIFEMTENNMRGFMNSLSSPFFTLILTRQFKPLTLSRIFWTYICPIFLIIKFWDGLISRLRTYSVQQLKKLVSTIKGHQHYTWKIGKILPGSYPIIYLVAYPKDISKD